MSETAGTPAYGVILAARPRSMGAGRVTMIKIRIAATEDCDKGQPRTARRGKSSRSWISSSMEIAQRLAEGGRVELKGLRRLFDP